MLSKVYDALIEAGASKEKAEAAAAELAGYEGRFALIERHLAVIKWSQAVIVVAVASLVIEAFFA